MYKKREKLFITTLTSVTMFCVLLGEYIALYQSQRAIMKQKHHEKEQYISMLAQDKEEMKVVLSSFFISNKKVQCSA